MIWHDAQKPSRGTFGGILAVFLLAVVFLFIAVRVGAAAPNATAWIECDYDGCQSDIIVAGKEPIESFCSIMAIETPSDACNILGPVYLYWRNTWSVYAFPSLVASLPA